MMGPMDGHAGKAAMTSKAASQATPQSPTAGAVDDGADGRSRRQSRHDLQSGIASDAAVTNRRRG